MGRKSAYDRYLDWAFRERLKRWARENPETISRIRREVEAQYVERGNYIEKRTRKTRKHGAKAPSGRSPSRSQVAVKVDKGGCA